MIGGVVSADQPVISAPTRYAIVVASRHHGNTRRVAEAMAEEMKACVLDLSQARDACLSQYEVVGFGSGIYFGRHDPELLQLVQRGVDLPRSAFVFSTAGTPALKYFFHAALRRCLIRKGCHLIGEFSCSGWDSVGPLAWFGGIHPGHPDAKDLANAKQFVREKLATHLAWNERKGGVLEF